MLEGCATRVASASVFRSLKDLLERRRAALRRLSRQQDRRRRRSSENSNLQPGRSFAIHVRRCARVTVQAIRQASKVWCDQQW